MMATRKARTRLALAVACALLALLPCHASNTPDPSKVTIAGSLQSELGCPGDWQPDCSNTNLTFNPDSAVFAGTFQVPAGSYEYKAALNGSWTENYGRNAQPNGANIPLVLGADRAVKFYYDHETHWITDNVNSVIASVPGSFQHFIGCPGDWAPDCLRSWLQDPDGDGTYTFTTRLIPAGNYECKVAINESWNENYGQGGAPGGANIPFTVPADGTAMKFSYDPVSHILTIAPTNGDIPQPNSVTIAGSLQSELGCSGDWQPDCAATHLALGSDDAVWQGTFSVPAGSFEYKAALNDSWDENYGANAQRGGANIPLSLADARSVKFYYDHGTHWITSNANSVIATVPGNFQHWLGCPGDWAPDCLRSWLQDPDGDGTYTFQTRGIPAGDYECKVAIDESWNENYGQGGAPGGANITFTVPKAGTLMTFVYDPNSHVLTVSASGGPRGNLGKAKAHWVLRDTLAWDIPVANGTTFWLTTAPQGGLALSETGVTGGASVPLTYDPAGLPDSVKQKFPHLANFKSFKLAADQLAGVPDALRGQIAISELDPAGTLLDATSIQIPGVLDDLYAYDGALGVSWNAGAPTIRVWAPTAKTVKLVLFDTSMSPTATTLDLVRDDAKGTWSITGQAAWKWKYYQYQVDVYVPKTGKVETNLVTDPYSQSLSMNGWRTQIVDLNDPSLKPAGWDMLKKPRLDKPNDITLYELHIRDFSVSDPLLAPNLKGTYRAFAMGTAGTRHLGMLALAGLTHVHLLPTFDISSVNEDKTTWQSPGDLSVFPPDSDQQQAAIAAIRDQDGFNWGYDPFHFLAPEGSYSTDPDGPVRIREFREMVAGLGHVGLRVVMDSVFNHTSDAGQSDRSVLDKVVPGYYHRLNLDGAIETSSCCQNTATEHVMMNKLMIDALVMWARDYKVDGFRFDLMGHHMKSNILEARDRLHALTPERDGVDGRAIYLYGEGWNFGEVADNARGVNAVQANMAGTGVGTFNDRLRDGARGGGPFSPVRFQGFLTGLFTDPNGVDQGDQLNQLLLSSDWIRVGLAGGLKDFTFIDRNGNLVKGSDVDYNGQHAGYTLAPQELINYVSAHDNETLFDAVQLKAAGTATVADRIRMSNLGVSLIGFAQGIPFFHAGDELLRSKSMDRNSYNSGDWFNTLDYTYHTNNWGVGLPPAADNQSNWPIMQPLLANPALKVSPDQIRGATAHFMETLAIRRSTHLFHLTTADEVQAKLRFHNTGPQQIPGLIVMSLSETTGSDWGRVCAPERGTSRRGAPPKTASSPGRGPAPGTPAIKPVKPSLLPDYDFTVVLFNQDKDAVTFTDSAFAAFKLFLHPFQATSADPVVRGATFNAKTSTFTIPGRTAAVFVCGEGPRGFPIKP